MPIYTYPPSPTLSVSEVDDVQHNAGQDNQNVPNHGLQIGLPVVTHNAPRGVFVNGNTQMEPWWLFHNNGILAYVFELSF